MESKFNRAGVHRTVLRPGSCGAATDFLGAAARDAHASAEKQMYLPVQPLTPKRFSAQRPFALAGVRPQLSPCQRTVQPRAMHQVVCQRATALHLGEEFLFLLKRHVSIDLYPQAHFLEAGPHTGVTP